MGNFINQFKIQRVDGRDKDDFMPMGYIDTDKWWRHSNLRKLNFLLLVPLLSIFSQGYDGSMMNGLQSVEQWRSYFGTPKGALLGFFNAAYQIGCLVGVFFVSPVSDTFGRRSGMAVGAAVSVLGGSLQAGAANIAMFIAARFILGIGCTITAGVGSPWITEIAHPKQRSTATALFLTFWSCGATCAAWVTFGSFHIQGTAAWRIPSGLQAFPSLIQLAMCWFVPESPRWLMSKGREAEAQDFVLKYHAEGVASDPLAIFEFKEMKAAFEADQIRSEGRSILGSWLYFVKTPGNRKRTAILIWAAIVSQLSGNGYVAYYLSPILTTVGLTSTFQQTLVNATSQMFSWTTGIYFATLPSKLGRRTMFLWGMIFLFICNIVITAGSAEFANNKNNKAAAYAVVVFLYLFSPAYNFGLNANLGLYVPEILPYSMRTKGIAFFYFWQAAAGIFSSFTTPVGLEALAWKFYLIYVGWIVVEAVGIWFLFPETNGPSLEDIAFVFDGHGGQQTYVSKKEAEEEAAVVESEAICPEEKA